MDGTQLRRVVNNLIDKGYNRAAESVIKSVSTATTSGVLNQRLNDLNAEAVRLAVAGKKLDPQNPYVIALLNDLETVLKNQAHVVDNGLTNVQEAALTTAQSTALRLTASAPKDSFAVKHAWNNPDPEAIQRIYDNLTTPEFRAELTEFIGDSIGVVRDAVIRNFAEGKGPKAAAREVRQLVEGYPAYRANNLLRTTFNVAHREAQAIYQNANQHILTEQVRIATLDKRCCLSCINLHGKRFPLGQRIDDHHQGRCLGIGVVKGFELNITSGEDWFKALPENDQQARMGPGRFADWKAGKFGFKDLSVTYQNPLFGRMVRTASLKDLRAGKGGTYTFYLNTEKPLSPAAQQTVS